MKTTNRAWSLLVAALIMAWGGWVPAETVPKPGDPAERVVEVLGEPQGYLKVGAMEVYVYERGRIEARDGTVVSVDLITAEEALARRLEQDLMRTKQASQRVAMQEAERHIQTERLSDTALNVPPRADRADFWESFRQRYPDGGGDEEYARLIIDYRRETERIRMQRQLNELEQRTLQAEERARQAERVANAARRQNSWVVTPVVAPSVVYRSSYGGYGWHSGYPLHSRYHRPGVRVGLHGHTYSRHSNWSTSHPLSLSIHYRVYP